MAKLPQVQGGSGLQIKENAPDGQHIAVCLRVADLFNVERPTFADKTKMEMNDVTRFIYGIVVNGKPYLIQTYEFTISGAPGANLMKFLKQWLGRDAEVGWDYCEQLGKGAMITIQQKASRTNPGKVYANITGISPVHPQLAAHIPNPRLFDTMLAELERNAANPQSNPPPTPPGPVTQYPNPPAQQLPPPLPPVASSRKIFVHVNGAATPMTLDAVARLVATGQGALPAIYEGDTTWSTCAAIAPAAPTPPVAPPLPLPPPFPPVVPTPPLPGASGNEEDVPF